MNRKTKIILIIVVFLTSSMFVCLISTDSDEIDYPYPAFVWDIEPDDYVGDIIFLKFTAFTEHVESNITYGVKYRIDIDGAPILETENFVPYYINEPLNILTDNILSGSHLFSMTVFDYWNRTVTLSKTMIIDRTPPNIIDASISNTTIEEGNKPIVSWKVEDQHFSRIEIWVNSTRQKTMSKDDGGEESSYPVELTLLVYEIDAYYKITFIALDSAGNRVSKSWVVYYFIPEDRFPKYSEEDLEALISGYIEGQSQARIMGLGLGMGITLFATIGLFPGRVTRKVLNVPRGLRGK